MKDHISKAEIRKDAIQDGVEAVTHAVGAGTNIVVGAVSDLAKTVGGLATDLFERYRLSYTTGSLPKQVASAWRKVIRLSLPNDFGTRRRTRKPQIGAAPGSLALPPLTA